MSYYEKFKAKADENAAKDFEGLILIQEAIQVLQVTENFTAEIVEERFTKLFNTNDPTKGAHCTSSARSWGRNLPC